MLVRRTWIRKTFEIGIRRDTDNRDYVYRYYRGLFLFGFIPIWIDNYETKYE
jgi:hypothetical protein